MDAIADATPGSAANPVSHTSGRAETRTMRPRITGAPRGKTRLLRLNLNLLITVILGRYLTCIMDAKIVGATRSSRLAFVRPTG